MFGIWNDVKLISGIMKMLLFLFNNMKAIGKIIWNVIVA